MSTNRGPVDFGDLNVLLLSFNREFDESRVEDYALGPHPDFSRCWVLDVRRASSSDVVVAVAGGLIRSVCVAHHWHECIRKENGRKGWAFEGAANHELSRLWVGRPLPSGIKFGRGNPVRYWAGKP